MLFVFLSPYFAVYVPVNFDETLVWKGLNELHHLPITGYTQMWDVQFLE